VASAEARARACPHDAEARGALIPIVIVLTLAVGSGLRLAGDPHAARAVLAVVLLAVIAPLAFVAGRRLLRGQPEADVSGLLRWPVRWRSVSSRPVSSWR
jgi:hypothetical protein